MFEFLFLLPLQNCDLEPVRGVAGFLPALAASKALLEDDAPKASQHEEEYALANINDKIPGVGFFIFSVLTFYEL